MKNRGISTKKLVGMAILLAMVVVLQLYGSGIKIGTVSLSLTLIPIVLGGAVFGPFCGALLGFVFGAVTFAAGLSGADPFTQVLISAHPAGTALIAFGKGTLAGLGAALVFKLLQRRSQYGAVLGAAAAAPVINTGLFIIGALFLSDTLRANFVAEGTSVLYFLIIGCAGVNFIVEFLVNLLVAPALYRVVKNIK